MRPLPRQEHLLRLEYVALSLVPVTLPASRRCIKPCICMEDIRVDLGRGKSLLEREKVRDQYNWHKSTHLSGKEKRSWFNDLIRLARYHTEGIGSYSDMNGGVHRRK